MKTRLSPSTRQRLHGSAMLVSLMIMGVTTIGIAGWLSLIGGRRAYTDTTEYGMRRRVVLENSRAIGEEYMYGVAANADSGAAASFPENPSALPDPNPSFDPVDQPDTVEQMQIAEWNEGPMRALGNTGRVNRSSASNGGGFARRYAVSLGKGDNLLLRDFEMRSRSPILAGDLLTLGRATLTPWSGGTKMRFRGNVKVDGRTVLWYPASTEVLGSSRLRSEELAVMSSAYGNYSMKNAANTVIRASNFPARPITSGAVSSSSMGYDGQLSLVKNEFNTLNSLHSKQSSPIVADGNVSSSERGVVSLGNGKIVIDLSDPALDAVYINNDVYRVVLVGQQDDAAFNAADGLQPVSIIIEQDAATSRNLGRVELEHRNNRRLVVGVKTTIASGGNANWLRANFRWMDSALQPSTGFPTWRLICLGENTSIIWTHEYPSGNPPPEVHQVTVFGGVQTDREFWANNHVDTRFFLKKEPNPLALDTLLPRQTWLETYPYTP